LTLDTCKTVLHTLFDPTTLFKRWRGNTLFILAWTKPQSFNTQKQGGMMAKCICCCLSVNKIGKLWWLELL
jgi:hypothetical protein